MVVTVVILGALLAGLIAYGAVRQRRTRSDVMPGRTDNLYAQSYRWGKDKRSGP